MNRWIALATLLPWLGRTLPRACIVAHAATALSALLLPLSSSLALADVPEQVLKAEAERIAVLEQARAATIAIFARGGRGGGSGVVISADGFALSNFHVTSGAGKAMKAGMADGTLYDAVIVGLDPTGDVALIKLLGREDFPHAELGNSDEVRVGDTCFAVGNPFLLATDFQPTVTYGIVSGVHRYQYPAGTLLEYADCIQADASINPGNSGGPLFNARGQVIGINGRGSFEKRGRVNVGVGYAISINQIKNFMGCLKSGRIVDHATVGAQVATSESGKVLVTNILEESDAYRRGLRYGDEITAFGGRSIDTANAFKNVLGIFPKGWRVPLTYHRDGERFETLVRLAGVHREGELYERINANRPQPQPDQPRPGQPRPGQPGPGQPRPIPNPPDGPPPDGPQPQPNPPGQQGQLPPEVAKFYEAREGYTNYYFNRIAQERIWRLLQSRGDFASQKGKWLIDATAAGDLPARFELSDKEVVAQLPGGRGLLPIDDKNPSLSGNFDPLGSGGMFSALYLWRRFLTSGPAGYGEVYYYGTLPYPGQSELVDCLIGVHAGVQCHFFLHPHEGYLLGLEMFAEDNSDPCELLFSEYSDVGGRLVPRRLEVRYGDSRYQVYKLNNLAFENAAEG